MECGQSQLYWYNSKYSKHYRTGSFIYHILCTSWDRKKNYLFWISGQTECWNSLCMSWPISKAMELQCGLFTNLGPMLISPTHLLHHHNYHQSNYSTIIHCTCSRSPVQCLFIHSCSIKTSIIFNPHFIENCKSKHLLSTCYIYARFTQTVL